MRHRIVLLDRATIGPNIQIRRPDLPHDWREFSHTSSDELEERLQDATILVTNKVPLGAEAIAAAPHLQLIAIAATGYNHIDLEACREQDVTVCNIRDYARHTVPEHVLTLILMLFRQIKTYEQEIQQGKWQAAGQFCFFTRPKIPARFPCRS